MNIGYFFIFIAVLDFKADDILKAGKSSHLRGVRSTLDSCTIRIDGGQPLTWDILRLQIHHT
jgi:hypothetical protein